MRTNKPYIKIETYKIVFNSSFAKKHIQERKIASVIPAGAGYAIGFFHKESDVPLPLRDELLEVKFSETHGHYISSGMFAKAHGEGMKPYKEIPIGADRDPYFQL